MRRPTFFIVGAPKCGTTSLAAWLAAHPRIFFSRVKEPHFFNTDGLRGITDLETYEELWVDADERYLAVGEGSTHYLYSREAVVRILAYQPDAKFIVCARNPLHMAPALHAERVWQGRETVRTFQRAWELQGKRAGGKQVPRTTRADPDRLQYGSYCKLGEQLTRLSTFVPRERVCVVLLEDMAADPKREYERVLTFLGVTSDDRTDFPVHNRRKDVRSPLLAYGARRLRDLQRAVGMKHGLGIAWRIKRMNSQSARPLALPPELHEDLVTYFRNDTEELGALLGRDLVRAWLIPGLESSSPVAAKD